MPPATAPQWTNKLDEEQIARHIQAHLADARIAVQDMTGTRNHWEITVVSNRFEGLGLLERHRVMHDIMRDPMASGAVHAVKFKTKTPAEAAK